MDPLKEEPTSKKYLLVMVDKFTKWIEAKPVVGVKTGRSRARGPELCV